MDPKLDSPLYAIVNIIILVMWVAAAVDVYKTPRRHWVSSRAKLYTALMVSIPYPVVAGVFVPIMPTVWFLRWRRQGGAIGYRPASPDTLTSGRDV